MLNEVKSAVAFSEGGKKSQAAISSMLTIGAIVVALGLSIAGIAIVVKNVSFFHQKSDQAFYLAEVGIEDGLINLARNPSYGGSGGPLLIGPGSVIVEVETQGSDKIIRAQGTILNIVRKIEVRAQIDPSGKVSFVSFKEVK